MVRKHIYETLIDYVAETYTWAFKNMFVNSWQSYFTINAKTLLSIHSLEFRDSF